VDKKICLITNGRLGSKRLPSKMINDFAGNNSLFRIICEKFKKINNFPQEDVWVSIYEQQLKDIAYELGIKTHHRSYESANCDSPISLIWDWCNHEDFAQYTHYCYINPCLPLLTSNTISEFVDFCHKTDYNSVFGVKPICDYVWKDNGESVIPGGKITLLNTKDKNLQGNVLAAHCLYHGRMDRLRDEIQLGGFLKGDPYFYTINNKIETLDVDDNEDWIIAEAAYEKIYGRKSQYNYM